MDREDETSIPGYDEDEPTEGKIRLVEEPIADATATVEEE